MVISSFFTNKFFKKNFVTKMLTLEIDSAASSRGQGKLLYFIYFVWPRFEIRLYISTLYVSYLNAVGNCFLFTGCFGLFISKSVCPTSGIVSKIK